MVSCTDVNEPTESYGWYHQNPDGLARRLSLLDEEEFGKFTGSDLLDVQPVLMPTPENVDTFNEYLYWPIATVVDDTILVLYAQKPHHFKNRVQTDVHSDDYTGIRKIIRSEDGGKTWSRPIDLLGIGKWDPEMTPFEGWNASMGSHEGIAYVALKEGLYRSKDKGVNWKFVTDSPDFGALPLRSTRMGMRMTFDEEHGMILWCTDLKRAVRNAEGYGGVIRAVYSPDFGETWHFEEQTIPEEFIFSELTPLEWEGKMVFLNRNPENTVAGPYVQCASSTGWFPFDIRSSGIEHGRLADTPDLVFNPISERFEAAVSMRFGINADGPSGHAKVNLYSIDPDDLFAGKANWRFDGTWIRYRGPWGLQNRTAGMGNGHIPGADYVDGFNPVGGIVLNGQHHIFVWGGDGIDKSGIFQYSRSLDTDAVRSWLLSFYE